MLATLVIILLFILLTAWFALDFNLGQKQFINQRGSEIFPHRKGRLTLFSNGNHLFKQMFSDIEQAKKHIHICFYIVKNDEISKAFYKLLKRKAKEGVEVRLLVDRLGSLGFKKKEIESLRRNGVHFAYSQQIKLPFLFHSLNTRNHRKIAIIDCEAGYMGGFNIGKEYLGLDPALGTWKDYHLRIQGEASNDLQTQFLRDWKSATKEDLLQEEHYFQAEPCGESDIQICSTEGNTLEGDFLKVINEAKEELCIGTPYFIPSEKLLNGIFSALSRGVKVNILVPMKSDHPFVRDAAFNYLPALVEAGCHIYQYYYGFYHAKVIIADEKVCDIGTGNFDKRSLFLNKEINCYIYDSSFIKDVKTDFYDTMHNSSSLSLKDIKKRKFSEKLKQSFATFISPLL